MPIYEYFCTECGKQSEISHRMSDPPARDCPVCGKPALTKQMSAAGFRLKGGGWYETDFKSGGKRNLAEGGGTSSSGDAASPAATSSGASPAPAASSTPAASSSS
ncbi:FmdB family zinc ribbon protein [Hydrocarboniphaga effusa]